MTLTVDIRHRLGEFRLDIRFETAGGLVALLGRSGSGKTSIINTIAGLIKPDAGFVSVDDMVLVDTERQFFVSPHLRRIGYVFQEGRLFPHLTVRQNLLYGRWFAPRGAGTDFDGVVDLLGIGALLERRPARLSGGEKQRVAIGRALLAKPRLLLMDEPLASLDEARKAEILPYIEKLRDQASVPIVYVSHSISEVARLASTIVLVSEGKLAAVGPTAQIIAPPRPFSTDRAGRGRRPCRSQRGAARRAIWLDRAAFPGGALEAAAPRCADRCPIAAAGACAGCHDRHLTAIRLECA
jgi:molybdate transport system ATP-binding protein